ncbi:MAG: S8 family serine peptidase, partial [Clostridia bacterium]|nr:S8 family serine peptidase [Clostridia bacterium]
MKNRTRKAIIRSCSLAMVAFSLTGVALYDGNTGKPIVDATVVAGEDRSMFTDVSDKYDTSALRSQYLNGEAVSANMSVKDEFRWVIVDLGGTTLLDTYLKTDSESFPEYIKTAEARSIKEKAERNNEAFLSRLSLSGIGYEWKYSYTTLNNGVAIKIRNSDVAKVKKISGVKEVYSSESYAVPAVTNFDNNAHTYTTGIYDTSEVSDYSGEGMTVAVLDTGLDYTHAAFQTMPNGETLGLDRDQVGAVLTSLESYKRNSFVSLSDVYYNDKVPYAFDYSDDDADVYPSYSSHGTHVAGIIAGRDDSKIVNLETGEKFIGVAPDAQLVICKVFTDNLDNKAIGSANAIDILASLADCVTLGVDVINMSLGTSAGFSEEGFATAGVLQDVYERIERSGISLVCAASNDYSSGFGGAYGTNLASNPDSGTVGSPSTYATALSVASINGQKARYFTMNGNDDDVAFITDSSNANGKAYNFIDELYEKTGTDKSQPLTLNYVVVGGLGRTSNYTSSVKRALADGNTIAVVKRGDISFAEKVQNAMVNGALACIIYNNVSGNIRMTLGEVNDPIPTCSISMDAGKLLIDGSTNNRGTVTFSYQNAAGPFMSDFSSWGPTP